ncbi:MAG: hypothetical protein JSV88_08820 [Candidatus Aminicenantes bacterium]|nr:MAG: hypothetical protein JSV88_08820 [Candidatus Aminicenantes bacterium]
MMRYLRVCFQLRGAITQQWKPALMTMVHPTKIEAAKVVVFNVCLIEIDYTRKNF